VVLPGGANGANGEQPGAGAGDVNGDGYADIVVASEQQGMLSAVYLGSAAGLSTTPVYLQVPGFRPQMLTIGAGDIDGDGYADVLGSAGAVNQGDNLLYVYRGGAAGIDTTPTVLIAPSMESWPLTAAGDLNGDGFSDVALWSNTDVSPGINPLDVYFASASGLAAYPSKSLTLTVSDDSISASVTSAGDVNGDGYADVLVGSRGQAQLLLGGPGGLTLPSAQTLTTPVTPATYYGWATGASGAGF
jgi:hypothetical protein